MTEAKPKLLLGLLVLCSAASAAESPVAVPFERVEIAGGFWFSWLELNRRAILPHNIRMIEETGVLDAFRKAAGKLDGGFDGFHNSDEILYKTVEAAAFETARRKDAGLDAWLRAAVAEIAAAQEPDGYLCTPATIWRRQGVPDPRFAARRLVHELYLFGHLYEAAVAHYRATGSRALLEVACKNADLVDRVFGPGGLRDVPNHPNIEQALVKLHEAAAEPRYLNLARFFVDQRGRHEGRKSWGESAQDHIPVVEQFEMLGQAPRATYLYSGAADVARLTGDAAYRRALSRLWENAVTRKMYLTGGIGSREDNEGFGPDYDLPNASAYAETCAAVSFSMWNQRMFLLDPDARYIDVLERTLYNNFLAGTSLSGEAFFYANPLESDGVRRFNRGWTHKGAVSPYLEGSPVRKRWFFCACCPPNVARQMASLGGYAYAADKTGVYVNLYLAGAARLDGPGGARLTLRQETRYPWEGAVRVRVDPDRASRFALRLRIPGWARGYPVPGDLYRYADPAPAGKVLLRVNGRPSALEIDKGYAVLLRDWKPGDIVDLGLPMAPRRVESHPRVEANRGRIALERGPVVYCLEGADHGGKVLDILLPRAGRVRAEFRGDLLGGVVVLRGGARRRSGARISFTAIPYYAWANRGAGEMAVWLPEAR